MASHDEPLARPNPQQTHRQSTYQNPSKKHTRPGPATPKPTRSNQPALSSANVRTSIVIGEPEASHVETVKKLNSPYTRSANSGRALNQHRVPKANSSGNLRPQHRNPRKYQSNTLVGEPTASQAKTATQRKNRTAEVPQIAIGRSTNTMSQKQTRRGTYGPNTETLVNTDRTFSSGNLRPHKSKPLDNAKIALQKCRKQRSDDQRTPRPKNRLVGKPTALMPKPSEIAIEYSRRGTYILKAETLANSDRTLSSGNLRPQSGPSANHLTKVLQIAIGHSAKTAPQKQARRGTYGRKDRKSRK